MNRFNRSAFDSRTKVDIVYDSETRTAQFNAFVLIVALAKRIKFLTLLSERVRDGLSTIEMKNCHNTYDYYYLMHVTTVTGAHHGYDVGSVRQTKQLFVIFSHFKIPVFYFLLFELVRFSIRYVITLFFFFFLPRWQYIQFGSWYLIASLRPYVVLAF